MEQKNGNNKAGVDANKKIIEIIMRNSVFTQPVQAGDDRQSNNPPCKAFRP